MLQHNFFIKNTAYRQLFPVTCFACSFLVVVFHFPMAHIVCSFLIFITFHFPISRVECCISFSNIWRHTFFSIFTTVTHCVLFSSFYYFPFSISHIAYFICIVFHFLMSRITCSFLLFIFICFQFFDVLHHMYFFLFSAFYLQKI